MVYLHIVIRAFDWLTDLLCRSWLFLLLLWSMDIMLLAACLLQVMNQVPQRSSHVTSSISWGRDIASEASGCELPGETR
jgi:hypothetical protein